MSRPYVICVTGASGVIYAVRLLEVLASPGRCVHLSISSAGRTVLHQELNVPVDLDNFQLRDLFKNVKLDYYKPTLPAGQVVYHHQSDLMAPIASGSFLTAGMVIVPCSGSTMSAVVSGASANLIQRAADVHLKERRTLILVPRETPLSELQLTNMKRACELGAHVLPAMPGWYHGVQTPMDLVDFVVARILDQLGVSHDLMRRWGQDK